MIISRFSPCFFNPAKYGVTGVRPFKSYSSFLPHGADIKQIAYHFSGDYISAAREYPHLVERIENELEIWILVGSLAGNRRRGLIVYGAWITGGFMLSALGLQISIVGLYLAALAAAGALTVSNLVWTHTLQELVPRQMLGRVSSIDDFAAYSLIPVGYLVTGWATDRVGAAMVFLVGGAVTAGLAALGLTNRAIRTLE